MTTKEVEDERAAGIGVPVRDGFEEERRKVGSAGRRNKQRDSGGGGDLDATRLKQKDSQSHSSFPLHHSFHLLPSFLLCLCYSDPNEPSIANGRSSLEGFESEGEEEIGFGREWERRRGRDGW